MTAVSKRFIPLGVILLIGIVHLFAGPREQQGCTTACSPKALDLNAPVTAWLTP